MGRHKAALAILFAAVLTGCSQQDQRTAQERAREADQKANVELHKLGQEAKQDAHRLNQELARGMNGTTSLSTQGAGQKLDHAGQVAQQEIAQAGVKLDHATLIARVKSRLAADVGLSTVANVQVDASGTTITLSGTVQTDDQKHAAEQSAARADGVTNVVNKIEVKP